MKRIVSQLVFPFFLIALSLELKAQERAKSVLMKIETLDGNEFVRTILEDNDSLIRIDTDQLGELKIRKSFIKDIQVISRSTIVEGRMWLPQP
jgi:hypothetical protein